MGHLSRRIFVASLGAASCVLGANNDIRLGIIGVGSTVKAEAGAKWMPALSARSLACALSRSAILGPCQPHREVEQFAKDGINVEAYTDLRKLLDNKDIMRSGHHAEPLARAGQLFGRARRARMYTWKNRHRTTSSKGERWSEAAPEVRPHCVLHQQLALAHRLSGGAAVCFRGQAGQDPVYLRFGFQCPHQHRESQWAATIPKTIDYDLWCGPGSGGAGDAGVPALRLALDLALWRRRHRQHGHPQPGRMPDGHRAATFCPSTR